MTCPQPVEEEPADTAVVASSVEHGARSTRRGAARGRCAARWPGESSGTTRVATRGRGATRGHGRDKRSHETNTSSDTSSEALLPSTSSGDGYILCTLNIITMKI